MGLTSSGMAGMLSKQLIIPPTNVTVSNILSTSFNISWTASTVISATYLITATLVGGGGVITQSSSSNSATVTTPADAKYNVYVQTIVNGVYSVPSQTVTTIPIMPTIYSILLNGYNQYGKMSDSTIYDLSMGTIEAWIKTNNAGGYRGIVVKKNAYSLFLYDNVLISYNWKTDVATTTSQSLTDNVWHHVALVFKDGATNESSIYIDGTLKVTFTTDIKAQDTVLCFGCGDPPLGQFFPGYIAYIRIWNVKRTSGEISAYYNKHITHNNMIGFYPMTENSGTSISNQSINNTNNPFTLQNNPSWSSNAPTITI